jgi:hypothetical protein
VINVMLFLNFYVEKNPKWKKVQPWLGVEWLALSRKKVSAETGLCSHGLRSSGSRVMISCLVIYKSPSLYYLFIYLFIYMLMVVVI